jgi:hypothetical protein
VRKEDGVFDGSAPWISADEPIDIVFRLKLPNDEDILTGRLEKASERGARIVQGGAAVIIIALGSYAVAALAP